MSKQRSVSNSTKIIWIVFFLELIATVLIQLLWSSPTADKISYVLIGNMTILLILGIGLTTKNRRSKRKS